MRDDRAADSPAPRTARLSRRRLLRRGLAGLALTSSGMATAPASAKSADPAVRRAASFAQTQPSPQFSQQQKLTATDGDSEDFFGESVAVSSDGTTALIGAPRDEDPNGPEAGSAYVFTERGGAWSQQQKLAASVGRGEDRFGFTVAVSSDGTTALIGAAADENPNGDRAGSVYVFTESGGTWSQQQKLTADDGDSGDFFGGVVAVSSDGTTALIGALRDEDPNGPSAGSVYVFTESEGTWSQQQKLTATDGDRRDFFGRSMAVSSDGTTALIGAPQDEDPNGDNAGSAYVFTESGGTWSQQQKLTAPDGDRRDLFGGVVAVSSAGTTALIGALRDEDPNGDNAGSAYVFTESEGTWSQQQKLTATDGDSQDGFGVSVAVSGDGTTALIGAAADEDPNGDNAGSAYVFTESEGTWSQQQKLTATDGDRRDFFGLSVAVSSAGTTALIGARGDEDPNGNRAGSAYVFTSDDTAPGGGAGPSVRVRGQQAGPPGGQARVAYELTTGGQESVTLAFTLPSVLSLTPSASKTSPGSLSFNTARQQVVFSPPDGIAPAVVPTVTIGFDIAADLSPPTTVEIDTAVLDETGTTTDRVRTTVEITALSGTAGEYDTNGDPGIQSDEVLDAISDFNEGDIEATDVLDVISAFNENNG